MFGVYIIIGLLVVLVIWGLMVYVRKTMWDAVHRNLLDLEDHYDGRVERRSFAARPYFHGRLNGVDITVNFSTERSGGKRMVYVDISYGISAAFSFTAASPEWLKLQGAGQWNDGMELTAGDGRPVLLRDASLGPVRELSTSDELLRLLNTYPDLAYIFAGKSGIIYEFITEEVIKATEFESLNQRLLLLEKLGKAVSR